MDSCEVGGVGVVPLRCGLGVSEEGVEGATGELGEVPSSFGTLAAVDVVAGHGGFFGDGQLLWKPLLADRRGEREARFYGWKTREGEAQFAPRAVGVAEVLEGAVAADGVWHHRVRVSFLPHAASRGRGSGEFPSGVFSCVRKLRSREQMPRGKYVLLQDLRAGLDARKVSVVDVKVGGTTWGPDASAEKALREGTKYMPGWELGFRLTGLRAWRRRTKEQAVRERAFGKSLSVDEAPMAIVREVCWDGEHIDWNVCLKVRDGLRRVRQGIEAQHTYHFHGSSVLIVIGTPPAISSPPLLPVPAFFSPSTPPASTTTASSSISSPPSSPFSSAASSSTSPSTTDDSDDSDVERSVERRRAVDLEEEVGEVEVEERKDASGDEEESRRVEVDEEEQVVVVKLIDFGNAVTEEERQERLVDGRGHAGGPVPNGREEVLIGLDNLIKAFSHALAHPSTTTIPPLPPKWNTPIRTVEGKLKPKDEERSIGRRVMKGVGGK